MNIRVRKGWEIDEREVTDEKHWLDRRELLRAVGLGTIAARGARLLTLPFSAMLGACQEHKVELARVEMREGFPAKRNPAFAKAGRPITGERLVATYNNFYEFSLDKAEVHELVGKFVVDPWSVEIGGLVDKPGTYAVADLERLVPIEERVYRFRCVEAWAMTVPWTGIPFAALLGKLGVQAGAKYVRFHSFERPAQAPGQKSADYPWPYYEALTLDEALNELTLLGTGLYGKPLRKQNGAPIRLVVPWKYGLKNIKSITRIDLVAKRPGTFWNAIQPREYGWESNVEPEVPHPRWSQASERLIGSGERVKTLPYNGYGRFVAKLYR